MILLMLRCGTTVNYRCAALIQGNKLVPQRLRRKSLILIAALPDPPTPASGEDSYFF
jgi:hypothetical protein